jgi:predicted amidohydrolase
MRVVLVQPQLRHAAGESNLDRIRTLVSRSAIELARDDLLLLPEGFHFGGSHDDYKADVGELARDLGCHVVGGSHREQLTGAALNAGIVADPDGREIARYEKMRPYASEREWVQAGNQLGEVRVGGFNLLIFICADFWFADLFQRATHMPDIVLVPALSVTRKPTPDYSRTLWQNLAVARAYEFGAYVGISDWGHPSELPLLFASGVGGFADPTTIEAKALFRPIGAGEIAAFPVDRAALDAFRADRMDRGFFWKARLQPAG